MKQRVPAPLGPVLAAALTLTLAGCNSQSADTAGPAETGAPSTEFVAENPTAAAVPVDLPTTPMTNAPAAEASPAKPQ